MLSLDPTTLGEVMADIRALGMATRRADEAEACSRWRRDRHRRRHATPWTAPNAPAVAALEWLDPPFIGGHWVPQMVELAGGVDMLGLPGEKSRSVEWAEVDGVEAGGDRRDAVRLRHGPLGRRGARRTARSLAAPERSASYAVDAAAYFSRPGPRLVDGVELLAHILHPDRVADAAARPLRAARSAPVS